MFRVGHMLIITEESYAWPGSSARVIGMSMPLVLSYLRIKMIYISIIPSIVYTPIFHQFWILKSALDYVSIVRILHYGAYHQGFHFLLRQNDIQRKNTIFFEITYNLSALNVYNGLFQAYCLIVSNPKVVYINTQKG